MSTVLEPEGERILHYLVSSLKNIDAADPRTFPTYKRVLEALKLDAFVGPTYGIALDRQGLANLAYWAEERGLPAITGLVIDQTEQKPGTGFFDLYGKEPLDYTWWLEEMRKVKSFDWSNVARS